MRKVYNGVGVYFLSYTITTVILLDWMFIFATESVNQFKQTGSTCNVYIWNTFNLISFIMFNIYLYYGYFQIAILWFTTFQIKNKNSWKINIGVTINKPKQNQLVT
jgi:hypothetical protein